MDQRVQELCAGFPEHLAKFGASDIFSGPSWYFHQKTLQLRAQHESVGTLVEDEAYFDALYATLTAWGLHRMGPGKTKLRDIAFIREGVRQRAEQLDRLVALNIVCLSEGEHAAVVDGLWALIADLQVSVAEARIVANSKLLHHILPNLVPPIDRQYTFRFFYGRTMLSIDEERAFREMFRRLILIAQRNRVAIETATGTRWNTSAAKVVDNAIIGYMLSRAGIAPDSGIEER